MADGILISRENFKAVIEALRWIDEQYENVNLDHRHFRVGAKVKASDALEALFSAEPVDGTPLDPHSFQKSSLTDAQ